MNLAIDVGSPIVVRYSGISILGRVIKIQDGNITAMTPFGNSIEVKEELAFRPTEEEERELDKHEKSVSGRNYPAYQNVLKMRNGRWESIKSAS